MGIGNRFFRWIVFNLAIVYFLSACSGSTIIVPTASLAASPTLLNPVGSSGEVPTNTPVTPATATTAPTDTLTTEPSITPTIAATAAATSPLTAQVIPTINPYCRKGPGYGYDAITFLLSGTAYTVIGRDSLNSWWQVQAPGNVNCWVMDSNVNKQGPVEQVSIVRVPPLPGTPAQFVNSYVCKDSKKTVALNWAEVANVTGYNLYRDGDKLAQIGPTMTSYSDNAPPGESQVYELEAFNDYGVALLIATNVPSCK